MGYADDRPDEEQMRILKAMTPAQRYQIMVDLYNTARELKTAGVRMLHPEWTDEEVEAEVRRIFLHATT